MASAFQTRRRIEFADTDMAGIVHFANFFRFMESAEQEFLRSLGLSVSFQWEGQAVGFPRVSASCDFMRPARFEDVLDVAVRVRNLGRKSVTYSFDFSKDCEPVAYGEVSTVCCRIFADRQFESIEIPAGIRQRLSPYAQPPEAAK